MTAGKLHKEEMLVKSYTSNIAEAAFRRKDVATTRFVTLVSALFLNHLNFSDYYQSQKSNL